jgi:DUF4097 and DUF4098 domain-containing protein YvlB
MHRSSRAGFRCLIALTLVAWLPSSAGAQSKETERVDRVFAIGPGGTLKLKNFSGSVTITGTGRSDVSIKAVRIATREKLDRIRLEMESSGSTVTIDANRRDRGDGDRKDNDNVVRTEFDIEVPSDTRLDLSVFSSPVTVKGVTAEQEIHGFSSDVRVADVSSRLRVKTFSGGVEVGVSPSTAEPELDVNTFSGDIRVTLPEGARGRVSFSTFSGGLHGDMPLTLTERSRRNRLSADLGGGAGKELRFHTFSGDVTLRR